MDPTAVMRDMLDAKRNGRYDEARELGEALTEWINKGGFPPEGHTRESTVAVIRTLGLTAQRRPTTV